MSLYALSHLSDRALTHSLGGLVAQDRRTTAQLLAHLAEVDRRKLYAAAGFPSLFEYCVGELGFSEDAACTRINAARTAHRFPLLYDALAEGRIHLTALRLLTPHLTPANAAELVVAATHRRKSEIEHLLASRFPQPEALRLDEGISALRPTAGSSVPERMTLPDRQDSATPGSASSSVPERMDRSAGPAPERVQPLSAERFALQVTVSKATHDKLRHAQALLAHAVPSGDVATVLDRALDALITVLEKRKHAATDQPRRAPRASARTRHIPAHVRREVWERDQGRCTFVSASGRRCGARSFLEFDHVDPVARGGRAETERMRLRCRTHNQYEAERAFGTTFMERKRREATAEREGRATEAEGSATGSG